MTVLRLHRQIKIMMIIIVSIIEKQVRCVVCNSESCASPQVDQDDNNDYCRYYALLLLCSFIMIFLLFFSFFFFKLQTGQRFKRTLFIRTSAIFRVIFLVRLQSDT